MTRPLRCRRLLNRNIAQRGDRGNSRRPHRGEDGGQQRDGQPDDHAGDDGRAVQYEAGRRQVEAECAEETFESGAYPDSTDDPKRRRDESDEGRFDDDGDEHLATGRADRSEQRHLSRALGHDDRERVVDHEAADDDRDDRECGEEDRDEAEVLLDVVLLFLRDLGAREGLRIGRQRRLDACRHLVLRHSWCGLHSDRVDLPGLRQHLLSGRQREQRIAGAERAVRGAELRDADEVELLWSGRRRKDNRDRVADLEVTLDRAAPIDHDFVGRRRRMALGERERVELRIVDPVRTECRGALARVAEHLAVGADDLGAVRVDLRGGVGDTVDPFDGLDERVVKTLA